MNSLPNKKKQLSVQKTRLSVPAFLLKTYEMIENKDCQDVVCWNSDGQSFVIKNINEFSEKVLSNYFKHKNFASFVRQLNMYDFHKIRNENNETEFRHRLFQRGNKNLLIDIKRKSGENGIDDQQESGQMSSIDMVEIERIKKDCSLFLSELMSIKQKYTELERIVYQVVSSVEKAYTEKKLHDGEFLKFKEEQSNNTEKLFFILSSYLTNQSQIDNDQSTLSSISKKLSQNTNNNVNSSLNQHNLGNYTSINSSSNANTKKDNNNSNISTSFTSQSQQQFASSLNMGGNNADFFQQSQNILQGAQMNQQQQSSLQQSQDQQQQQQQQQQQLALNQQNLNSSFHSLGENESVNSSSHNNNNSNNTTGIALGQIEHRISKKQDWAAVQQLRKDGDTIPVCPLPFVQKKKENSQLCLKKIQNLADTFKNIELTRLQRPDAVQNLLQQILNGKTMTVSEDAVNQFALGSQAKRMFGSSTLGGNSMNSGRQNIQLFENTQKRLCSNSQQQPGVSLLNYQMNTNNSSNNIPAGLSLQLGITDGLDQNADLKAMSLFQQQNSKNLTNTGLFSPSLFNGGDASPRLAFNIYPSPTLSNGGQGGFQHSNNGNNNNNILHQGLQTFLSSPSPNRSPMLLREMEEFITSNNMRGYPLEFGQASNNNGNINNMNNNGSSNPSDGNPGSVNNIENNKRLSNDLLRSFKTEHKADGKYY